MPALSVALLYIPLVYYFMMTELSQVIMVVSHPHTSDHYSMQIPVK